MNSQQLSTTHAPDLGYITPLEALLIQRGADLSTAMRARAFARCRVHGGDAPSMVLFEDYGVLFDETDPETLALLADLTTS